MIQSSFFSKILFLVTKIFWKDGVQVWLHAERMFVKSRKACLPKSENIYEKKVLLNENFSRKNFFGHVEESLYNRAAFFQKSLFCPNAKSRNKNKNFPRKICISTKSLRTRRIFENTVKKFSKTSEENPHQGSRKRKQNWLCENYCFCAKFIWTRNLHF